MAPDVGTARGNAELVENSRKVLYKVWMFAQTSRLILASPRSSDGLDLDQRIQFFALLESMLVHARELMLFLYAAPSRQYIRATDYLTDPKLLPPKWKGYNGDLDQINKGLAHLTWDDLPEPIMWTVPGNLTPALLKFVKAVPADRVIPNFKTLAAGPLSDQSSLAKLSLAPRDGTGPAVRGHRVHELFERGAGVEDV